MTKNAPIGSISDHAAGLAGEIRRRTRNCEGACLAWVEHGDVFAQGIATRAAMRIHQHKPELIIGLYTKAAKADDIEADVEVMKGEVDA